MWTPTNLTPKANYTTPYTTVWVAPVIRSCSNGFTNPVCPYILFLRPPIAALWMCPRSHGVRYRISTVWGHEKSVNPLSHGPNTASTQTVICRVIYWLYCSTREHEHTTRDSCNCPVSGVHRFAGTQFYGVSLRWRFTTKQILKLKMLCVTHQLIINKLLLFLRKNWCPKKVHLSSFLCKKSEFSVIGVLISTISRRNSLDR